MRNLIIVLLLLPFAGMTQNISVGTYGSTGKFLSADIGYHISGNGFYIGYGHELKSPPGKHVNKQLENYGKEMRDFGTTLSSFDIGYSRKITDKLSIKGVFSIGRKTPYIAYWDDRFKGCGYYLTDNSQSKIGGGGSLLYLLSNHFGVSAGYNTIKEGEAGIFVKF